MTLLDLSGWNNQMFGIFALKMTLSCFRAAITVVFVPELSRSSSINFREKKILKVEQTYVKFEQFSF